MPRSLHVRGTAAAWYTGGDGQAGLTQWALTFVVLLVSLVALLTGVGQFVTRSLAHLSGALQTMNVPS